MECLCLSSAIIILLTSTSCCRYFANNPETENLITADSQASSREVSRTNTSVHQVQIEGSNNNLNYIFTNPPPSYEEAMALSDN
ncbi:unnamed protein product [Chironomus riparius]|uniref:Uncharacterized protein n=1 Tax=Chironomus riparius TaxID=315576 RepID=A0A9N9S2L6_9DIPT|nr:unnamed protein product [Chironomus riparius]